MGLSAPLNVHWELTNVCNLKCRHCYQQDDGPRHGLPNAEDLATIARRIIGAAVFEVILTGGEVLLVPQLPNLIRMFNQAGIRPHITSNGMLVDESTAQLLSTLDLTFQVSLDAADPSRHNDIRRSPRAFEGAISGTRRLIDHGVEVSFAYTAMPDNLDEVSHILVLAADLGVQRVCVGEVLPEFGSAAVRQRLSLQSEALGEFTTRLAALRDAFAGRVDLAIALLSGHLYNGQLREAPCTALERDLAILHDGWAAPCPFVRDSTKRLGNVLHQDISAIWSGPAAKAFRAEKAHRKTKHCVDTSPGRGPIPLELAPPLRLSRRPPLPSEDR
jgi:MoaA/NifB/PqqE/SkfB family radical SAM enzyme